MKNWWYYHKWYVVCCVILLLIAGDLLASKFGWFKKQPDLQIAYIGKTKLPEDTVAALETVFASLADDYNKDGTVLVQVNQYATSNSEVQTDAAFSGTVGTEADNHFSAASNGDPAAVENPASVSDAHTDTSSDVAPIGDTGIVTSGVGNGITGVGSTFSGDLSFYQNAYEIPLIGDITDCTSYLFLMEDPKEFQLMYQLLAMPDGSCPDDKDFSVDNKVFRWDSCSLLSDAELGDYSDSMLGEEVSGENKDLLSGLYLGRRCFFTDKRSANEDGCAGLWEELVKHLRVQ